MNIKDILEKNELTKEDLVTLMKIDNPTDLDLLFKKAYEVKAKYVGRKVYYRDLLK